MSEEVDEFVGKRFGNNEHLEVVEWDGSREHYHRIYTVICHICKNDPEMYGQGLFRISKNNLAKGSIPCGCASSARRSKDQFATLIERKCKEKDYKFIGFVGDKIGNETKLELLCFKHNHVWKSTSFKGLVLCGYGCGVCKVEKSSAGITVEDETHIAEFFATGSFKLGTIFSRSVRSDSRGGKRFWSYKCSCCSNDEYALAGLCTGVFEAVMSTLKKGQLACRCSDKYTYTKEQAEYKIKSVLEDKYKMLGWNEEFKTTKTHARLHCKEHGEWVAAAQSLVNAGTRCPSCASGGFKQNLPAVVYVFRICGDREFTGYGISNFFEARLATHKLNLKRNNCYIAEMEVFYTSGENAYKIEKNLIKNFETEFQTILGFKKEATKYYLYDDVIQYVEHATM